MIVIFNDFVNSDINGGPCGEEECPSGYEVIWATIRHPQLFAGVRLRLGKSGFLSIQCVLDTGTRESIPPFVSKCSYASRRR